MKLRLDLVIKLLKATFIRKILGPHVHAFVIKSESGLFAVDPEDEYGVGRKMRKTGNYGLGEIERLKRHIALNSKVLIVGAHVGTLAIPISKLCEEVVAIEANPASYDLLTANIALNSAVNCRAVNIAASDKDESIEFLLSRVNSGGSKRVPRVKKYMYYYDKPEVISVKAVCLDKYLEGESFDIIVMDIEGSEYFALQGMQEILSKCKILAIEFVPHHLKYVSGITVEQFLSAIGPHFSKLTIPSKQLVLGASEFAKYLTEMYNLEQEDGDMIFEKI